MPIDAVAGTRRIRSPLVDYLAIALTNVIPAGVIVVFWLNTQIVAVAVPWLIGAALLLRPGAVAGSPRAVALLALPLGLAVWRSVAQLRPSWGAFEGSIVLVTVLALLVSAAWFIRRLRRAARTGILPNSPA